MTPSGPSPDVHIFVFQWVLFLNVWLLFADLIRSGYRGSLLSSKTEKKRFIKYRIRIFILQSGKNTKVP